MHHWDKLLQNHRQNVQVTGWMGVINTPIYRVVKMEELMAANTEAEC